VWRILRSISSFSLVGSSIGSSGTAGAFGAFSFGGFCFCFGGFVWSLSAVVDM